MIPILVKGDAVRSGRKAKAHHRQSWPGKDGLKYYAEVSPTFASVMQKSFQ